MKNNCYSCQHFQRYNSKMADFLNEMEAIRKEFELDQQDKPIYHVGFCIIESPAFPLKISTCTQFKPWTEAEK